MKKALKKIAEIGIILLAVGIISQFAFQHVMAYIADPKISISLVNEDHGAVYNDREYYFGEAFVKQVEKNKTYDWIISSRAVAENKLNNNEVDLVVIIPSDFSKKALAIDEVNPSKINLTYLVNASGSFSDVTQSNLALEELKSGFNASLIEVYFASILRNVDEIKTNLTRISQEDQIHEDVLVNDILRNTVTIDESILAVRDYATSFASTLENFEGAHESYNQKVTSNQANIDSYLTEYSAFSTTYNANNILLANLQSDIQSLFEHLNQASHQAKFEQINDSFAELENYFSNDLLADLEEALRLTRATLALSESNSELIEHYIAEDGPLENYYQTLSDKLTQQDLDTQNIDDIIQNEITELCEHISTSVVSEDERQAYISCVTLGYIDEATNETTVIFTGQSIFAVEPDDITELKLNLTDHNMSFEEHAFTICRSTAIANDNVVIKDENYNLTNCVPLTDNVVVEREDDDAANPEIATYTFNNTTGTRQYITINYTVKTLENTTAENINILQRLRVLNQITNTKNLTSIVDQNIQSGKRVVKLHGVAAPDAEILLCAIDENEAIVDLAEQCNVTAGTISPDIDGGIIPSVVADPNGAWQMLVTFSTAEALDDILARNNFYLTQKIAFATDGDRMTVTTPANINTETITLQDDWELLQLTKKAHAKLVVPGSNVKIISENNIPTDAKVHLTIMDPSYNIIERATVYPNALGEWEYISNNALTTGDIVQLDLEYIDTITNLPVRILNQQYVRDLAPLIITEGVHIGTTTIEDTAIIRGVAESNVIIKIEKNNGDGTYTEIGSTTTTADGTWEYEIATSGLALDDSIRFVQMHLGYEKISDDEYQIVDTTAPEIPVVTTNSIDATTTILAGTGEAYARIFLDNMATSEKYCTIADNNGTWSFNASSTTTCEDELGNTSDIFTGFAPLQRYNLYQMDASNNKSNAQQFYLATEPVIFNFNIAEFDETTRILTGTTMSMAGVDPIYIYYLDTTNTPQYTTVNADGSWELHIAADIDQTNALNLIIYTSTSADFEADFITGINNFSHTTFNITPSLYSPQISENSSAVVANNITAMSSNQPKSYQSTIKLLELEYENNNLIYLAQLQSYFQTYYDKTVTDIYTNQAILTTEEEQKAYFCPGGTTQSAVYCFVLSHQSINPQEVVDSLKESVIESFTTLHETEAEMQTNLTEIIAILEAEIEAITGAGGRLDKLSTMKNTYTEVENAFNEAINKATTLSTDSDLLATGKASEYTQELAVAAMHPDMLERSEELTEQSDSLLLVATSNKETAMNFAQTAEDVRKHSETYVGIVQTEVNTIQSNLETNENFIENIINSFQNSQINGIENENLYGFLSQPVVKDSVQLLNLSSIAMYPYLIVIICTIISLLIAYYFATKKEKVKLGYEDEYLKDTLKAHVIYLGIMELTTIIAAFIVGFASGYFAGFEFWQYVKWIGLLTIIMSGMTQCMYWLLQRIKVGGLFIILGTFTLYLITHNVVGVIANTETMFGKILINSPFKIIENSLNSIVLNSVISTGINETIILCTTLLVLFGLLNVFQNTIKIYRLMKRDELNEDNI